jgi:hypothetical protein
MPATAFGSGRVGAIVKGATQPAIARIYGAGNVSYEGPPGRGRLSAGRFIYRSTANALVGFSEDGKKIEVHPHLGQGWKKEGIRIGTTLAGGRINGGPFKFFGFCWDNGGAVISSGKLPRGIIIALAPTRNKESKQAQRVMGDSEFSSRHPALKSLGVVVSGISVTFGP